MNVDAMLLTLLALGDVCLLAYMRQRRARRLRLQRVSRSLTRAVLGELHATVFQPPI